MRDWRAIVRARLTTLRVKPTTEMDVADEIAQHLEDRFEQFRSEGLSEHEAAERARCEIEGDDFLSDLTEILPRGE
jgi:hypothetical protein